MSGRERIDMVDGQPVRYLEWEGTAPALVAWPGMGGTAEYFELIAEWLPNRILAIDPPGVGPVSRGLPTMKRTLAIWTAALASAGPAVAIGHSWGAYLARLALARWPAQVQGAILLDGGFVPWQIPGTSLDAEVAEGLAFLRSQVHPSLEAAVEVDSGQHQERGVALTPALERVVKAGWMRRKDGRWHLAMTSAAFVSGMRGLASVPPETYLAASGPTLLITSGDEVTSPEDQATGIPGLSAEEWLAYRGQSLAGFAARPQHQVVKLEGLTHEVLPGRGQEVAAVISVWLAAFC